MPDTWTARAEMLAAEIRGPGFAAAAIAAAAWSARVEPDATRSLVRAALYLTNGDATSACTARSDPSPHDWTFTEAVSEVETHMMELLAAAEGLAAGCADALAGQPGTEAARPAAADCEAALEVTRGIRAVLEHALAAIRQVPADMGDVYEVPYQYLRAGGTLPLDGDFLTGTTTRGT